LQEARSEKYAPLVVDGHVEVDTVLIAGAVNAVRGAEISDATTSCARNGDTDVREPGAQHIAQLSVETGYPGNLTVDIPIRHIGVVRIVLIPSLVGEPDGAAILEPFLDGTFDVVGLVGERRTANALGRVRI